jgi:cytidylate kinase
MSTEFRSEHSSAPAPKIIVAIDGPAGAGKSTIARHLARHFGLLNLETGAMYRAFALKVLRTGLPLDGWSEADLQRLAQKTIIHLAPTSGENRVFLDGEDVTGELRDAAVTDAASRVSVFPAIRAWLVGLQQQMGASGGVVMEGRDIGTVVFPHAEVKIFLDAAPEVRGMRRFEQMGAHAQQRQPEEVAEKVIQELRERDKRDRNRADSPLKPAEDAVVLDSTDMTLEEAVKAAERIVAARLAGLA